MIKKNKIKKLFPKKKNEVMSVGLQDTLGMKFVSAVFKLQLIKCRNSVIIIAGSEKDIFGFPELPPLLS